MKASKIGALALGAVLALGSLTGCNLLGGSAECQDDAISISVVSTLEKPKPKPAKGSKNKSKKKKHGTSTDDCDDD